MGAPDPTPADAPVDEQPQPGDPGDPAAADPASTTIDSPAGDATVTSTPSVPAVPGTPSWLTGEFYVALAPLVAGLATLFGHHLVAAQVQEWLVGAGTVIVGAYALGRTLLKVAHVHSAAQVARAQAIAAAQATAIVTRPAAVDVDAVAGAVIAEMERRFVLRHRRSPK